MAGSQAIAKTSIALSSSTSSLPGPGVHQRHLLRLIALPPLYQLVSTVHTLDIFSLAALQFLDSQATFSTVLQSALIKGVSLPLSI